jgi:hypothetical protein
MFLRMAVAFRLLSPSLPEELVQPVEFDLMFEARIIDLAVCLAAFR